ncbi:divergent polysaccharide deacetylase family protein [Omnitrophica bacterium]|nr:divergent polysaccharide deacetylase family protein [Candidatus Omnitrophota bacterium]
MKNAVYIAVIAVLAVTSIFYWQRSRVLSYRLTLIQERIEESRKEIKEKALKEKAEETLRKKAKEALSKARVAIILDDWGYNVNNVADALALDAPITFSILPNLPFSQRIARAAQGSGKEVILHLPMEPYEDLPLEKNTIMTDMTDAQILLNLEKAILSVPHLKGISNHMGSKATEDERLMSAIFKRMEKGELYFLDSLVTNGSVCRDLSRRLGVKFVARSVFLDNESDPEYIKGQIRELAHQALNTGWALGIGHDRALTIEVLSVMIPELKDMGIEIVPVSEIAQ